MQNTQLTVALRQGQGKGAARKLRAAGKIPGVLYGAGKEACSVEMDRKVFDTLLRSGGHHGLLELRVGNGGEILKALVREIQVHPVSREVEHVDLQSVSMQEKIRIEVPIVLSGKPEGVKVHGGILEHNLRDVEVECLPGDIPQQIEVDVSALDIGQSLHVSDLKVASVVFLAHPDTTIATVSLPAAERAHEEAAATTAEEAEAATAEAGAEAKPGSEKPGEKEAKPGTKEAKPGAKEAKPAAKEAKPAAKEAKGGKEQK